MTLPQRVLTLNGASTLSRSVVANGASTITTDRWTAAQIELTSQRNARSSRYTLSAVDLSRGVTVTNGVISARTGSGTHTMNAVLPNGSWSVTGAATQGAVSYDANGVPTQGAWTVTLPHNRLGISVVPGTLTVPWTTARTAASTAPGCSPAARSRPRRAERGEPAALPSDVGRPPPHRRP